MKEVSIKTVYAFSINGKGGNPAGVVLDAEHLSNDEKQRVAAKLGLSEVAFVSSSLQADFKLDFFTPNRQIAHCGHATIATFSYLKQLGRIKEDHSSKETIEGNRDIYFKQGMAYMEQTSPSYVHVENDVTEILESLNVSNTDLLPNYIPTIVNTGNSFLIVPVANETILKNIKPNGERIRKYSDTRDLIGYYVFSLTTESTIAATARMFAPRYGIDEEAGTGMAAGPLASYLFDYGFTKETELRIKQGEFMATPSPSLIHVTLIVENNVIKKLYAGGDAFASAERSIVL